MSWFRYGSAAFPVPGFRNLTVCVAPDAELGEVEREIGKGEFDRLVISAGEMPNLDFLAQCLPGGPARLLVTGGLASLAGIDKLVNLVELQDDVTAARPVPQFGTLVKLEKCQLSWDKAYDAKSANHGLFTLPRLRELILRSWSRPDCLAFSTLGSLQALDLRQGPIASLDGLQGCPSLQRLSLFSLAKLKDFSALAGHPGLQAISMAKCPGFDDLAILGSIPGLRDVRLEKMPEKVANLDWLGQLQRLESLLVSNVQDVDWSLLFGLPALKSVALGTHEGYAVDDDAILALAQAAGRKVSNFARIGTKKVPAFTMDLA
jgi:hypothetical protein